MVSPERRWNGYLHGFLLAWVQPGRTSRRRGHDSTVNTIRPNPPGQQCRKSCFSLSGRHQGYEYSQCTVWTGPTRGWILEGSHGRVLWGFHGASVSGSTRRNRLVYGFHDPQDVLERGRWKFHAFRRLYERGVPRRKIVKLVRFFDWMVRLSEELENQLLVALAKTEGENKM